MIKTKFERIETGLPGVVAFRIEGKVGFHENTKIERLVEECIKRDFRAVIFDFSMLTSLGGGVAKILREFDDNMNSRGGQVRFVVTNEIIAQFLQDGSREMRIHRSYAEALAAAKGASGLTTDGPSKTIPRAASSSAKTSGATPGEVLFMPYEEGESVSKEESSESRGDASFAFTDGKHGSPVSGEAEGKEAPAVQGSRSEEEIGRESSGAMRDLYSETGNIIHEIFGDKPRRAPEPWAKPFVRASETGSLEVQRSSSNELDDLNRQLKKRILELKTLFAISSDFNAIKDRKKLLDIFLLTTIAEGGVESAVFAENQGSAYRPVLSKGMELELVSKLEIPTGACSVPPGENNVFPLDSFPIEPSWKAVLRDSGIEYACPFRSKAGVAGIVLLGKRIAGRGMKEEDFEFLRILVNIAQGAYDNALMFEHEHERTLGIVKTLISIIEENTLLKGTSELVSRYVGMVAKNMDYPEEHFKDLIYGTVLRDMGMVKVSDLILRSPRDLTKDEWEIIKRHPEDGAEMLARMKFSDHVVNIVRAHHERFNGEGYPYGLRGKEIPLGARIISVVESYAAMIHDRPTRPALSEREALETLKENYGLRYDREVVMQFARIMEKELAQSVNVDAVSSRNER